MSDHCFQCYYTCETCTGSNDYQCVSCYGDAQLELSASGESYCHNKNLIFKVFSSSRWYYILSLGFLINTILIIVLLIYIYRRKNKSNSGLYRGNVLDNVISPSGKGYKKVAPTVSAFHDEEESDAEQSDKHLTPYSDNPNSKPYRDDA